MEEQNNVSTQTNKPKTTKDIIEENSSYFNFYQKAPTVFTIISAIIFLSASIGIAVVYENAGYFFLSAIIGAVICFIEYLLFKLAFSYIILHISYLKLIEENTRRDK